MVLEVLVSALLSSLSLSISYLLPPFPDVLPTGTDPSLITAVLLGPARALIPTLRSRGRRGLALTATAGPTDPTLPPPDRIIIEDPEEPGASEADDLGQMPSYHHICP